MLGAVHDVVIVGGGTAGCVLAARLTEDPATSVLLLEAGGTDRKLEVKIPAAFSRLFRTPLDWGYVTAPQDALDGREVVYPRGRVLGGSASINAMMAIRGNRHDQERWPEGWSWDEVEPLYRRSVFPARPPRSPSPLTDAFVAAATAIGIPSQPNLNAPDNFGVGLTPVSIRRGRRFSVVDGYLRPARHRPNLEIVTRAHATAIAMEGSRAIGVHYLLDGRERTAEARREVVLSAGAVDSPKLLLLSGIGPSPELAAHGIPLTHELPGVGKGLRDHLANGVLASVEAPTLFRAEQLHHLVTWLALRRGPLTSNVAEAAAFVRTDPTAPVPDLELVFAPVLFADEGLTRPTEDGVTVAAVLLQPESVGEVRLRSASPLDPAVIDPRYLTDARGNDAHVLRYGIRLARKLLATEPLARVVTGELLPGVDATDDDALDAHLRAHSQTLYHPIGTCRMGTDDLAVVDPELRVRGIDGLRVVDASVIPCPPRGHTNWPTVMVAEKAADLIREQRG